MGAGEVASPKDVAARNRPAPAVASRTGASRPPTATIMATPAPAAASRIATATASQPPPPARGSHEATRFETNQRGREGDGAVASGRRREGRGGRREGGGGRTREGESRWGGPERGSMGRTSREADQI